MDILRLNKFGDDKRDRSSLSTISAPLADESASLISHFYDGKSILITGATGFIGKVLIEKLLYSCSNLNKIYLLIRSSKGKTPSERLSEMIGQKPFNIRLKQSFVLSKLVPIESDLALKELGLSAESKAKLIEEISIIFHVAASVKFEAPLEVNMRHNVVATKELLEFACQFKRLACFVHVSTAYSNCQLLQIDERVYPMEVPEDPMALKVTKQMIDNRPNTYTYTKAMAESVAQQYANKINVVIVRPSIVMSAIKEPADGWVDTINGPVGLSVLGALGILQKIKVNSEVVFDLIPVDIVTNALLSIAWAATELRDKFQTSPTINSASNVDDENSSIVERNNGSTVSNQENNHKCIKQVDDNKQQQQQQKSKKLINLPILVKNTAQVRQRGQDNNNNINITSNSSNNNSNGSQPDGTVCVFNLTTGSENPCSFYHYFNTGRHEACDKPSVRALRPLLSIPKQKGMNPIQYWIHKIFTHLLFAYVMDFLLGLLGQKKIVIKSVNRMHHANEMFDYFCSNQWNFKTDNVKQLRRLQSNTDKDVFNCDVRQIDWNSYSKLGWMGCRRFILKETDDSIGYAKKRYRIVCFVYYLMKLLTIVLSSCVAAHFIESQIVLWMLMIPVAGMVYLL